MNCPGDWPSSPTTARTDRGVGPVGCGVRVQEAARGVRIAGNRFAGNARKAGAAALAGLLSRAGEGPPARDILIGDAAQGVRLGKDNRFD